MTSTQAQVPASQTPATGATATAGFSRGGSREAFLEWAKRLHDAARVAPGFVSARTGLVDAEEFDWSLAVSFDTLERLDAWLDSGTRRDLLTEGAGLGFHRLYPDLVVVDGQPSGTGVEVFLHAVAPGREEEFVSAEKRLVAVSGRFPGFEGVSVLPPAAAGEGWLSVLRFRTDRQLAAWMDSSERRQQLPDLRSQLTADFTVITRRTPYGTILRVEDGVTKVTPNWKSAMLVLLVLYPTVMTLSRFLGPVLDGLGAAPWLSMWLSQIVSVGLMTFLLMPFVTGLFRRWLDPVQGAGARVTAIGALIIVVIYVATLALFANVVWLQFWQHPN